MTIFRTLTGDLQRILGDLPRRAYATIEYNVTAPDALVDLDNNKIYPPAPDRVPINADGTFSVQVIDSSGEGTNITTPGSLRCTFRLHFVDGGENATKRSWECRSFAITSDLDLSDAVATADPPASIVRELLEQAEAARDAAEAARDQATQIALGDAEAAFDGFLDVRDLPANGAALTDQIAASKESAFWSLRSRPDGPLPAAGVLPSGQRYEVTKNGGAGFVVANGAITANSGLVYLNITRLSGPVREFWLPARWVNDGEATDQVAVAIIAAGPFANNYPTYADAGLHALFYRNRVVVQNRSAGGTITVEWTYYFRSDLSALPFDEWHTVGFLWDGSTLQVALPSGATVTAPVDANTIAWWGPHPTVQIVASGTANHVQIGDFRITATPQRTSVAEVIERPAWAKGTKVFDLATGWYNANARTLQRTRVTAAQAAAGAGVWHLSVVGDSTHMNNDTPQEPGSSPSQIRKALEQILGMPRAGTGWVSAWPNKYGLAGLGPSAELVPAVDPRWKFVRGAGGTLSVGAHGMYTQQSVLIASPSSGETYLQFTPGVPSRHIDLALMGSQTTANQTRVQVSLDGGSTYTGFYEIDSYYGAAAAGETASSGWTLVPTLPGYIRSATPATTGGLRVASIDLGSIQSDVVVRILSETPVESVGATSRFLMIRTRTGSPGVEVSNLAEGGRAMYNLWQNINDTNGYGGPAIAVDLIGTGPGPGAKTQINGLKLNDWQNQGISVSAHKAHLTAWVQRVRATGATGTTGTGTGAAADPILWIPARPNSGAAPWNGFNTPPLFDFYSATYEVAAEQDCALFDAAWIGQSFTASGGSSPGGLYRDGIHPNDAGARAQGYAFARGLIAAAGLPASA